MLFESDKDVHVFVDDDIVNYDDDAKWLAC